MKYTTTIKINKPRSEIIDVFENSENLIHWQRGLQRSRVVAGKEGEVGSKRKLYIKIEGRNLRMTEIITKKNMPEEWHAEYESLGIQSSQKNYFKIISEGETEWVSESEFKFSGFMKIVAKLMPEIFKKRSKMIQEDFKDFIECNISAKTK
ncbi:SRPBCC family protein [Psychroflexus aestuariivivens]|uniref:SRPBCC family protein n=1 Tax=Psychroflexus aestuariivivens TaxID=1795040 RepID=UPI000FD9A373|nr:SRPBCC family protein [Psychroflexus aestuariivivens]